MQYLITAKAIYGYPLAVEADNSDDALNRAIAGEAQSLPPYLITMLPTSQWSIEPLLVVSASLKMQAALQGVVQLLASISGLDYADPRVTDIFAALEEAKEAATIVQRMSEELDDRDESRSVPGTDS